MSENGNKPLGPKEPREIYITWNPETGDINLQGPGMNPMEMLGLLKLALAGQERAILNPAPARVVGVGSPLMPHLRH